MTRRTNWRGCFLVVAALLGALAVAAGAFGAHALADRLPPRLEAAWATAARYHAWHALALLGAGAAAPLWRSRLAALACAAWTLGVLLFSGSLYLLALTGTGWLGAVTPLGGVCLIAGWLLLAVAAWPRQRRRVSRKKGVQAVKLKTTDST